VALEITCVVPDGIDPQNRVDRVGGPWGSRSEDAIIDEIENGREYFIDIDGTLVDVVVARQDGRKYLRTDPDATLRNELLSLMHCPPEVAWEE
jgi:hypothetical protein